MERFLEIFHELGDPTRLRVLAAILGARKNVSGIVAELGLAQPQVSYHLRKLREAGLAVEEKEGRRVWYQAHWGSPEARVRELLDLMARWTETESLAPPPSPGREPAAAGEPERAEVATTGDLDDYRL